MSTDARPVHAAWEGWERKLNGDPIVASIVLSAFSPATGGILSDGVHLTISCEDDLALVYNETRLHLTHSEANYLGRLLVAAGNMRELPTRKR